MITTKHLLFRALETGGPLFLVGYESHQPLQMGDFDVTQIASEIASVTSVEREDGNNRSFNVTSYVTRIGKDKSTIHVTTIG